VLLAVAVALTALLAFMATRTSGPPLPATSRGLKHADTVHRHVGLAGPSTGGYGATLAAVHVRAHFRTPVESGLLFDVHTGKVLWERNAARRVPIASLTKMMTALVVAGHSRPSERVLITRAAVSYSGSGVGLLPLHKQVRLETLLYGLLLPSGNDAAIALAQHVARTEKRFIAMMNERARQMGLSCSHFTTASGIVDHDNYSCATDLAVIAHAVLQQRRLARIVATSDAVLPFPIKGGKLYLYNNNPLLRAHYRGADGVKTGYTLAAGRCLVASARRGRKWLGVVLLHSEDPPDQARRLLDRGFATRGA
jgi:D-alanyl-D-alanine carboxypeptidase